MSYIGSTPTSQNFTSGTDYFSGTGSQTTFTLTRTVNSVNDIEVVINNVVQQPSTAYTLSGTTITFTSAPSSGTNNIYVRYLATNMQSFTVPANSITRTQLDSNLQAGFQGRNRIINGHMVVDQRNAGASVSTSSNSSAYTVDRWGIQYSQTSKFTIQQNAGSVTPPTGFTNYLGVTSSSAYSVVSSDYFGVIQSIEGYNIADLGWGTSNAKTVTLSFWVYSSLTGTFGGSLRNQPNFTYAYPFTYTINSANTWEYKTITITGATSGTWGSTNGAGIQVIFGIGVGSSNSGTPNAWASGSSFGATGATNVLGTNGATWYITGVQLEEGTTATSFEREAYSVTLQKCQRYYWQRTYYYTGNSSIGVGQAYTAYNAYGVWMHITNEFRATPTLSTYPAYGNLYLSNSLASGSPATSSGSYNPQVSAGGIYWDIQRSGGGLTAGNAVVLYAPLANATFGLSAEL